MRMAGKLNYPRRMVAFPVKVTSRALSGIDARAQFERLLIFVLCSLWAIGVVLWTLVSVVGMHPGVTMNSLDLNPFAAPTSLPTLQSAAIFAVRLVVGW